MAPATRSPSKDLVDDAEAQRVFGFERIAGQDRVHRRFRTDQSRQALRAAAARQQADLDLGQAHRRARRRDAIVAGERELESAAECGAVDRRDDRLRALFDVSAGRPLRLFIGTGRLAEIADVGAGDERATLPGDDDRFDRIVAQRRFEVFRQVEPDATAKGIDRRIVDGQQRDAIANFVVNSADKGHGSPRGVGRNAERFNPFGRALKARLSRPARRTAAPARISASRGM